MHEGGRPGRVHWSEKLSIINLALIEHSIRGKMQQFLLWRFKKYKLIGSQGTLTELQRWLVNTYNLY
jgi:hypothetical protein